MGTTPMRSDELQRPRARKGTTVRDPITYGELQPVDVDDFVPSPRWDEVALMMWDAALSSGQASYYQNSDLALLWFACDELTKYRSRKVSSMYLKEIMDIFRNLLVSEATRRQARIELQMPKVEEASYADIAAEMYSAAFGISSADPVPEMASVEV